MHERGDKGLLDTICTASVQKPASKPNAAFSASDPVRGVRCAHERSAESLRSTGAGLGRRHRAATLRRRRARARAIARHEGRRNGSRGRSSCTSITCGPSPRTARSSSPRLVQWVGPDRKRWMAAKLRRQARSRSVVGVGLLALGLLDASWTLIALGVADLVHSTTAVRRHVGTSSWACRGARARGKLAISGEDDPHA
jgi:hypothetical protein